jgi:hypothetical protein
MMAMGIGWMKVVLTMSIASLAIATVFDGFQSAFVLLCVQMCSSVFTELVRNGIKCGE